MFYIPNINSPEPEIHPIANVLFSGAKKSCIQCYAVDINGNILWTRQPEIVQTNNIFDTQNDIDNFLQQKKEQWKKEQAAFKKETGRTLKSPPIHSFRIGDLVFAYSDNGQTHTILVSDYTKVFIGGWDGKNQQYVEKIHWKRCIKIE